MDWDYEAKTDWRYTLQQRTLDEIASIAIQ